jgi:integrase
VSSIVSFVSAEQVDSARLQLLIHGKGGKDRYVPLAAPTLTLLRTHWRTHRSPTWLFVAPPRRGLPADVVWPVGPVTRSSLQSAFVRARRAARITKRASVHTLRSVSA